MQRNIKMDGLTAAGLNQQAGGEGQHQALVCLYAQKENKREAAIAVASFLPAILFFGEVK